MTTCVRSTLTAALAIASLTFARPALAGPPLLCHPYDIGAAKSLPWGAHGWAEGQRDYPLANLVGDIQALLGPSTPVIARMETLRRASIYASRDPQVAAALVNRLTAKARASQAAGHPDSLALLDAAYVTEALRQVVQMGGIAPYRDHVDGIAKAIANVDAWPFMTASLTARPDDPGIEFAAALIAIGRDRATYQAHAQRARAGASTDALLARNLSHISD